MRGISLQMVIGLIIAILAGAIILLLIFTSGLISNFQETLGVLMIMISAYLRIFIVQALNVVMLALAILIMVVMAIRAFKVFKSAREFKQLNPLGQFFRLTENSRISLFLSGHAGGITGIMGIAILIIYILMVGFVFSHIPFYAHTITVHLGSKNHPYNSTMVADEIANRIDTTWKIMGQNMGNPLEGVNDKPNPFDVFAIFPNMKDSTNMSYVYQRYIKKYGKPDFDIYVFCDNSRGIIGDLDPARGLTCRIVSWVTGQLTCKKQLIGESSDAGNCIIDNKSEVLIGYADAITGIGPQIFLGGPGPNPNCPYLQGAGIMNKDAIVICIKEK